MSNQGESIKKGKKLFFLARCARQKSRDSHPARRKSAAFAAAVRAKNESLTGKPAEIRRPRRGGRRPSSPEGGGCAAHASRARFSFHPEAAFSTNYAAFAAAFPKRFSGFFPQNGKNLRRSSVNYGGWDKYAHFQPNLTERNSSRNVGTSKFLLKRCKKWKGWNV